MSFHLEFKAANREEAGAIVTQNRMPDSVRAFLLQALTAVAPDQPVAVRAIGHLFGNGDYRVSSADIHVAPFEFMRPRPT